METKLCSATKRPVYNDHGAVKFLCPKCGEHEIIRSSEARINAMKYNCSCGFMGPN